MNQHSPLRRSGSLLERAAELYGFEVPTAKAPSAPVVAPAAPADPAVLMLDEAPAPPPRPAPPRGRAGTVDRIRLRESGFIVPDAPAGALAEEFRIVKRHLLAAAAASADKVPEEKRRVVLVSSAQPDEGKTFCAVNLALSLASEREVEVLLVDGDFPKPEILSILGLEGGRGLVDALADPSIDPESLVLRTDVPGLSVLPAGRHESNVTELLASIRTRDLLSRLTAANPKRIVIVDSPPALMASPANALAAHAGQLILVVRADVTVEADLREAVSLLTGCEQVSLLLNGTGFAATGRRFGSYYGYGQ